MPTPAWQGQLVKAQPAEQVAVKTWYVLLYGEKSNQSDASELHGYPYDARIDG